MRTKFWNLAIQYHSFFQNLKQAKLHKNTFPAHFTTWNTRNFPSFRWYLNWGKYFIKDSFGSIYKSYVFIRLNAYWPTGIKFTGSYRFYFVYNSPLFNLIFLYIIPYNFHIYIYTFFHLLAIHLFPWRKWSICLVIKQT